MFAIASMLLIGACDNAENLAAPRPTAPRDALVPPSTTEPVATPGPLVSGAGGLCADVAGAARGNGAAVIGWACHGAANQQWALQPSGAITVYDGAMCLDVNVGNGADGANVQIWACHGGTNQRWTRTATNELRSAATGKCLDLDGGRPGGRLQTWTCHGYFNQQWTIRGGELGGNLPAPQPIEPVDSGIGARKGEDVDPQAVNAGSAELPRVYLNTGAPTPTGRTISVAAGGDLQAALDAARPGDVVALAAGATFTGNFVLRPKAGMSAGQWITVRTSGQLPAEGTRVGPGDASQMPKVLTGSAAPAIRTEPGAQGWRLTGLEVGAAPGNTLVYNLVALGGTGADQRTASQVASRLVIDRSYVHGSPTLDLRRCVALNSASTAIVDSYLTECHSRDGDSQAIAGWNGPGPFKIVNNRLEGGHEGFVLGGADPSVPNLIPADVEVRRNYVTRPLSWRGVWPAKNLVEFKAGQRILLEGNVFENNWVDAQNGFAFLFWSANAEGNALWSVTSDVTFRYNRVLNVASGFSLTDRYNAQLPRMSRVTIAHNTVTGIDGAPPARLYQIIGGVEGVTIVNNSGVAQYNDLLLEPRGGSLAGFNFSNNITGAEYSVFAAGLGMGAAALSGAGLPASSVSGNVFAARSGPGVVPAGNAYAASIAAIGFTNYAGGDLRLSATSSFRASGVGGSVPGADVNAIAQRTQGVVR